MGTSAFAEPAKDSKSWQERLGLDLTSFNFSTDEGVNQLKKDIYQRTGFKVDCDRGLYGLWGSLSVENCSIGLTKLDAALKNVSTKSPLKVAIELGRPGLWQGVTFQEHTVKVPYNADPRTTTRFIDGELKLINEVSRGEMITLNNRLARRIADTYYVNVIQDSFMNEFQNHDGLKKVDLAMQIYYAGRRPEPREAKKLGFDSIVLAQSASDMYENNGELRVDVDIVDHPGQIFMKLINAVKREDNVQPVHLSWMPAWTWNDVIRFREDQNRVNNLKPILRSQLGDRVVECLLDNRSDRSIKLSDCRAAMENLQKGVAAAKPQVAPHVRKILIGNAGLIGRYWKSSPEATEIVIDYKLSPEGFVESVRTQ